MNRRSLRAPAGAAAPQTVTPSPEPAGPGPADAPLNHQRGLERSTVNIGKSVVIKGELNGSEDLTIEGQVEGKIELRQNVLTIGANGKIKAQVFAKAVIILGEVTGNVTATREGRHPRQRLGRRRHRVAARRDRRGRALPRQHRHAARRGEGRATRPDEKADGQGARSSPPPRRRAACRQHRAPPAPTR